MTQDFFAGQYVTAIERAIHNADMERLAALIPFLLTDVDNVPEELLPNIGYQHGIEANLRFLPANVIRGLIKNAHFIIGNIGTEAALNRVRDLLEISLRWEISPQAGDVRDRIDLVISPPVYATGDAQWAQYISIFLASLIPWIYELGTITIVVNFVGSLYVSAGVNPYEFRTSHETVIL